MFNYIVTAHKPSKVTHTAVGSFLEQDTHNLLVARVSRVDVYTITGAKLQFSAQVPLNACIRAIHLIRPEGHLRDYLVVYTLKYNVIVLQWYEEMGEARPAYNILVRERVKRGLEYSPISRVDPSSRMFALHQNEHSLKIFLTRDIIPAPVWDTELSEEKVIDFVFLHTDEDAGPVLAVLSEEKDDETTEKSYRLKTYAVSEEDGSIKEGPWECSDLNSVPDRVPALFAIPNPSGGVLLFAQDRISYCNDGKNDLSVRSEYGRVLAVDLMNNKEGVHLVLGTDRGFLLRLTLQLDAHDKISSLEVNKLGEICVPSDISYLGNDLIFIGSSRGDSALVTLQRSSDPQTHHLTAVDTYPHLGPITDFCFVDGDKGRGQGNGRIVTCSGVGKEGSLRVITIGVAFLEQARIGVPDIRDVFLLKSRFADLYHTYLIQSFAEETRAYAIVSIDEIEEVTLPGLKTDQTSLFCGNMTSDLAIQVTGEGIFAIDCTSTTGNNGPQAETDRSALWTPPEGCRAYVASCTSCQVLVGVTGNLLMYLEVNAQDTSLVEKARIKLGCEISCLSCSALSTDEADGLSRLVSVGLWAEMGSKPTISIFELPTLRKLTTKSLGSDVMARDLLLTTLGNHDYVLAGLGDGNLSVFRLGKNKEPGSEDETACAELLTDTHHINIGTQAVALTLFRSFGQIRVFVACDQPAILQPSRWGDQLFISNVNFGEVRRVCSFHSELFPDCLVLVAPESLQLGSLSDERQKLHVEKVPLIGEPHRITHSQQFRAYALLLNTVEFKENGTMGLNFFVQLMSDRTFEVVDSFALEEQEKGHSLVVASSRVENSAAANGYSLVLNLSDGCKELSSDEAIAHVEDYLLVGTAYDASECAEPTKGRLLVFGVQDDRLVLVTSKTVQGAVMTVRVFKGRILAAVSSSVVLFTLERDASGESRLREILTKPGGILITSIETRGNLVLVGDILRSVWMLEYTSHGGKEDLVSGAKDYDSVWVTAVGFFNEDICVSADSSMNLYTYKQSTVEALKLPNHSDDIKHLENIGRIHVGSVVTRIRHGTLVTSFLREQSVATPEFVFVTNDGMIGVLATTTEESFTFLSDLEASIIRITSHIAPDQEEWREVLIERPLRTKTSMNFIDGDVIELFLDLNANQKIKIARELGVSVKEIINRVEELQRLH